MKRVENSNSILEKHKIIPTENLSNHLDKPPFNVAEKYMYYVASLVPWTYVLWQ